MVYLTVLSFLLLHLEYFLASNSKMSPNSIFDRSFDIVRKDPDVLRRYGETIKGYGRDHGGHREGRRNFIEHTEYVDQQDGSKRVRVRYNIEGRFGYAFVFAEVSSSQPAGEFVYLLVQDKANGHTHTIVDNRAAMTAARLMGDNKEAGSAISQLLSGGKK
jgi:mitochondrial import inner membrane translocase subunit TIM21